MKQVGILLTLIFFSQFVNAYQFDIGLSHTGSSEDVDIENAPDQEYKDRSSELAGNFYFNDVSTANGPWREAPFMSKSSGIRLAVSRGEYTIEDDCCDFDLYDSDSKGSSIGVRGVINGFVIEVQAKRRKYEGNSSGSLQYSDFEEKTNTLTFGHYIGDYQQWYGLLFGGEDFFGDDKNGLGGGYKAVFTLGGDRYISVDASIKLGAIDRDGDDGNFGVFSTDASYYFNQQLSLDLSIVSENTTADIDGPDPESTRVEYLFGATYFPTSAFYVYGKVGGFATQYDNYFENGEDGDSTGGKLVLGLGGRF